MTVTNGLGAQIADCLEKSISSLILTRTPRAIYAIKAAHPTPSNT
jgi:hypothetical protein